MSDHVSQSSSPQGAERLASTAGKADQPLQERIRSEFREMPGFSPTLTQAARLFDVAPDECARVLGELEREEFLEHLPDGRYRVIG